VPRKIYENVAPIWDFSFSAIQKWRNLATVVLNVMFGL